MFRRMKERGSRPLVTETTARARCRPYFDPGPSYEGHIACTPIRRLGTFPREAPRSPTRHEYKRFAFCRLLCLEAPPLATLILVLVGLTQVLRSCVWCGKTTTNIRVNAAVNDCLSGCSTRPGEPARTRDLAPVPARQTKRRESNPKCHPFVVLQ